MAVTAFQTLKSFTQFLANWQLGGGNYVDQATANARAEVCAPCHNNRQTTEKGLGCFTCNKGESSVVKAALNGILKGRKTPTDGRLKNCAICGCFNRAQIHFPNQALLKLEEATAYPTFCWKKGILENKEIL